MSRRMARAPPSFTSHLIHLARSPHVHSIARWKSQAISHCAAGGQTNGRVDGWMAGPTV